jgi:hypothetical protein
MELSVIRSGYRKKCGKITSAAAEFSAQVDDETAEQYD